jgi:hypothetical protein
VPNVGSTTTVTVIDASWIVVGQMLYVDTAGGGTGQAGALQVTAKAGNTLTLLNPVPAPAIPLASSSTSGLLTMVSGLTTDFVDGTNNCQNLVTAIQPTLWSARLRSFQALGNNTFEVAQRNCGATLTNPAQGTFIEDRWQAYNNGSLNPLFARLLTSTTPGGGVVIPGTSYVITTGYLRCSSQTVKTSLAATDILGFNQQIEGPMLRELLNDAHSISILCRSSIANLKFGLALRDQPNTRSLTKLCTLGTANTITLITLPNILAWPATGNFTSAPGSVGYNFSITLAAGSTYTSSANDAWLGPTSNVVGALGQDNFLATSGAVFEVFFVQHEPGSICTTPMDCPFTQNYDACLRYYTKSYDYPTAIGSASTSQGIVFLNQINTTQCQGSVRFHKPMAKTPTMTAYNHSTGAVNSGRFTNTTDYAITNFGSIGSAGFYVVNTATTPTLAAGAGMFLHYTADTGW